MRLAVDEKKRSGQGEEGESNESERLTNPSRQSIPRHFRVAGSALATTPPGPHLPTPASLIRTFGSKQPVQTSDGDGAGDGASARPGGELRWWSRHSTSTCRGSRRAAPLPIIVEPRQAVIERWSYSLRTHKGGPRGTKGCGEPSSALSLCLNGNRAGSCPVLRRAQLSNSSFPTRPTSALIERASLKSSLPTCSALFVWAAAGGGAAAARLRAPPSGVSSTPIGR